MCILVTWQGWSCNRMRGGLRRAGGSRSVRLGDMHDYESLVIGGKRGGRLGGQIPAPDKINRGCVAVMSVGVDGSL